MLLYIQSKLSIEPGDNKDDDKSTVMADDLMVTSASNKNYYNTYKNNKDSIVLLGFPLSKQVFGTSICLLGVLILTPDSLLIRLTASKVPLWSLIFFRYLFVSLSCCVLLVLKERNNVFATIATTGRYGVMAGFVWGVSNFLVTVALLTANAANVLVILAANPLFSAVFSYVVLKEVVKVHTILASLVCFGAILLIFFTAEEDSSSSSGGGLEGMVGTMCALGACVSMSLYFTLLRVAEEKDG
ncbi:EamA family transporter [archaeon]|nr:MAG: EamA family transporter [archaeon]